jgi:ankyrin repeat protein
MRWLLNHGADAEVSRDSSGWTLLHAAASSPCLEAVQLLFDYNAEANSLDKYGDTPLSLTIFYFKSYGEEKLIGVVQRLLEHGADPNAGTVYSLPLHRSSSHGWLKVVRLLLSYGAKVDGKDGEGKTPFQIASKKGHHEIAKLLSEHVVVSRL